MQTGYRKLPGNAILLTYEELYGYGTHKSVDSLNATYQKRMREVEALIPKGLCASVYTQVPDVEEEVNGIFTYDREVRKISAVNSAYDNFWASIHTFPGTCGKSSCCCHSRYSP